MIVLAHIIEDARRQYMCRNQYRERPFLAPAQTIGGLQDRLLERSEALPRIGLDADDGIRRRAERAGQHRIGEQCDVGAGAEPVLGLKIKRGRLEGADEFIEPAWIGALEVLDVLLGVAERRTYARSFGVSGEGVCFVRVAMVGSICQPGWLQHDRTRRTRADHLSGVLRSNAGLIDEYQRIDDRSFAAAANKAPINAASGGAASLPDRAPNLPATDTILGGRRTGSSSCADPKHRPVRSGEQSATATKRCRSADAGWPSPQMEPPHPPGSE
jgi:hypothetical protein